METPEGRLLLIVEDDAAFARTLSRSFERRGYTVLLASNLEEVSKLLQAHTPQYAVVDLKLSGGGSGLACVQTLHAHDPNTLIVVLTGYASIATAVEAIKLGATQYLVKPTDASAVESAFHHEGADSTIPSSDHLLSVERLEWEYIQRVLAEHAGNVSATARALKMHRKTLQRKLGKHPAAR